MIARAVTSSLEGEMGASNRGRGRTPPPPASRRPFTDTTHAPSCPSCGRPMGKIYDSGGVLGWRCEECHARVESKDGARRWLFG